ncbi:M15 family metallopeptidase [Microbacterium sp. NEAU-LLC]|uniref:M15 family metallopeptidase n=1 Tax=Microbacterium helvum TaxID=2773713 RepID=A0ABR8NKT2_9MICO|nr:M15 family metallopeptidase [Microbacterium helvum]MBD3941283.1 M15 family metallopeptidase [Microbacterium helvum]
MTEPGGLATPRAAPETRRAARAMREEAERRARATAHPVGDDAIRRASLDADRSTAEPLVPSSTDTVPLFTVDTAPVLTVGPASTVGSGVTASIAPSNGAAAVEAAPAVPFAPEAGGSAPPVLGDLVAEAATPARHVRPRRMTRRIALVAGLATGAALLLGSSAAVTAIMAPPGEQSDAAAALSAAPPAVEQLPVPDVEQSPPAADLCTLSTFASALQTGDDEGVVVAAGGGEAFRAAVVEGRAPCVDLSDSSRIWTVLDKHRPANPIDYRPNSLVLPDGVRNIEGGALRADAAAALSALVTAARDAGAGELALESGFRSYQTQQQTYGRHFAERGERADQVSARAGYSEHQLGLSADVVACAGGCTSLDGLAATPQGQWVAAHAWEHGWIVRYVEGATPVTGYTPEPWHLRYVGPELAKAYHDGGWTSLEEFFGLEAAPDYLG